MDESLSISSQVERVRQETATRWLQRILGLTVKQYPKPPTYRIDCYVWQYNFSYNVTVEIATLPERQSPYLTARYEMDGEMFFMIQGFADGDDMTITGTTPGIRQMSILADIADNLPGFPAPTTTGEKGE